MPTCRRKKVVLTETSEALLQAVQHDPNKEVYYLQQTGEVFETYECVLSLLFAFVVKMHQSLCCPHVLL